MGCKNGSGFSERALKRNCLKNEEKREKEVSKIILGSIAQLV